MQVQDVQGETSDEAPRAMVLPRTTQLALSCSRHGVKSRGGRERHGTRGFKKLCGRSKTERVTSPIVSEFSQRRRAKATLRISANWASVKRPAWLPFSYQKRSQRLQIKSNGKCLDSTEQICEFHPILGYLKLRNWLPMTQAKVGPTKPPWSGVSVKPPVHKSMSSTEA